MGRAGSGGSSGGHSSGGHSSSRMSGGHRVGSSGSGHRAGSGTSFSSGSHRSSNRGFGGGYRRDYGPGMPPPPPPRHYGGYGPHYGGGYYHRSSPFGTIVSLVIMLIIVFAVLFGGGTSGSSAPKSTVNREKITGVSFDNNCVVDEIGWIDNVSKTERNLQDFYKKTGVQPYVVLHAYDSELTTDAKKEEYANKYYEDNIKNEGTFLFMYFAEQDTDNDVGYMCYVNGKQVSTVMDSEAVDIFWHYMDSNWTSTKSTDDVIVDTFNFTAKRIMTKSNTAADVGVRVVVAIIVVIIFSGIIIVMKVRRKNERERAAETERILNADINSLGQDDSLADRYTR